MRILLIDNEDLVLKFWRICLEDGLPGVDISEYQSEKLGRPAADFDWSAYDLLLLDYDLGRGENGIDWLQAFSGQPGFPITVLITAVSDPDVVARALRCGADGYLNKTEMKIFHRIFYTNRKPTTYLNICQMLSHINYFVDTLF